MVITEALAELRSVETALKKKFVRANAELFITLRRAVRQANEKTMIVIGEERRSLSDWLVWKREIAPLMAKTLGEEVDVILTALSVQINLANARTEVVFS